MNPIDNNLPMTLLKAQLDFQMQMLKLMSDSTRFWLQMGAPRSGQPAEQSKPPLFEYMQQPANWPTLGTLPDKAVWGQFGGNFGDVQSLQRYVLENQMALAQNMRDAMSAWQKGFLGVIGNQQAAASQETVQPAAASPLEPQVPVIDVKVES